MDGMSSNYEPINMGHIRQTAWGDVHPTQAIGMVEFSGKDGRLDGATVNLVASTPTSVAAT
jgi:hypothetical protein